MKIAILSDIHSNQFALQAAMHKLSEINPDFYFFLGDYFGYYPWAQATFDLLRPIKEKSIYVIGNHDAQLIQDQPPLKRPEYWEVLMKNRQELSEEAIAWLKDLQAIKKIQLDGLTFTLCHGTPGDPLNGRYYPDNNELYDWFPTAGEVLVMGHTHYKLLKMFENGGIMINPGSVGQPRVIGDKPSFVIFDTLNNSTNFIAIDYDVASVIAELEEINWYPRAIDVLKRYKHTL